MSEKIALVFFFVLSTISVCRSRSDESDLKIFGELHDTYLKSLQLSYFPEVGMTARQDKGMLLNRNSFSASENLNSSKKRIGSNFNASESFQIGNKCAADVLHTLVNMNKRWAIQIIDANPKIGSGMIYGNFLWTGNYRECVEAFAPMDNGSTAGNFHGQYCLVSWDIHLPSNMPASQLPLLTGVCIPDSCNETDLPQDLKSISRFLAEIKFIKKYSSVLTLKSVTCRHEQEKLNYPAICFIILLCVFGILMVSGTCITFHTSVSLRKKKRCNDALSTHLNGYITNSTLEEQQTESIDNDDSGDDGSLIPATHKNCRPISKECKVSLPCCCKAHLSRLRNILECFSVSTNGSKILNMETSDDQLLCLHGIRFFSMAWIILGHTYVHCLKFIDNIVDVIHDLDTWPAQVIVHGTFSVDSFFLISGFLLTHLFLKKANTTDGSIPWKYLYFHRYLRLTPPYAVLVGFNTLLFDYVGNGPFWGGESDAELCKAYWWWNLLYINNFLSIDNMCVAYTWYLANDMQFFIISSLFLYVLWRWPKIGIGIVLSLLMSSWITTWVISDRYKIRPMFYGLENSKNYTAYEKEMYQSWDIIYSKPYCRIGPYLIGVILAYVLHKTGDRRKFLKSWHLLIGWSLAIFFSLSVVYGFYKYDGNQLAFNFYNALSRSSFSLGIAWVIYLCLTEQAGVINAMLSHKMWIPLSRLTYCAYLIHPLIMKWYFQSLQEPMHFTQITIVMHFFGFLLVSYGIGFFAALAFESPVRNFEKFLT